MLSQLIFAAWAVPLVVAHPAEVYRLIRDSGGSQVFNGRVCTVERGTDRPGGDYKALPLATFQDCIAACGSDSKCLTAQYHTSRKYCYLKNAVNPSRPDPDVDGVVCQTPVTTTTTTKKTTPTTTTTTTKKATSSVPGSSFPSSIPAKTTTTTTTSKATTSVPGSSFPSSIPVSSKTTTKTATTAITPSIPSSIPSTTKATSTTAAPTPQPTSCADLPLVNQTKNGQYFVKFCGQAYGGGNSQLIGTGYGGLLDCIELCSTTDGCEYVARLSTDSLCYLLRGGSGTQPFPEFDSFSRLPPL